MPLARRRMIVALLVAALLAGLATATPPARAQDPPPGQNPGKGNAKPGAARKKPARRRPRNAGVGVIFPYPYGPSLIIRQTPESHDEIQGLLNLLRYN